MIENLRPRAAFATLALSALAIGALACSEATTGSGLADTAPPSIRLAKGTSSVDSVLAVTASVTDNLGIKRVHVTATGGITASYDTVFTSAVTSVALPLSLSVPRSVAAGTPVTLVGVAYDGAGNPSTADTLHLATGNLATAAVVITSPPSGSTAIIGKSIVVAISGVSKVKVQWLGFQSGDTTIVRSDSTALSSPLADSTAVLDTVTIKTGAKAGTVTLTPVLHDSLGNRSIGTPITLKVQASTNSVVPPAVFFGSDKRVELTDTVFVSANDTTGAGIARIGYEISTTAPTAVDTLPALVIADSVATSTQFTAVQNTFHMALPATFLANPAAPQVIYVRAFGVTANNARGYARLASGHVRIDTLVVVNGETHPLRNGGQIADAIYHPAHDKLYLTNIQRDQIEVFNLATNAFGKAIPVGSRPWGIAAWPRDRAGTYGDTLLVANSGGTSIGYVSLAGGNPLAPEGSQVYSYPLPRIVVYTRTTQKSPTTGLLVSTLTPYYFSDRPQFIAPVCKSVTFAGTGCDSTIVVYSTTPTAGQSTPFANAGTIRWENLTGRTSHFFFEQATSLASSNPDTLVIERFGAGCVTQAGGTQACVGSADSLLVQPQMFTTPTSMPTPSKTTDTTWAAIAVQKDLLGFRDTTFVRSSGNFRRAIFGEGGPVNGSRVLAYDVLRGFQNTVALPTGGTAPLSPAMVDLGVSPPLDVYKNIANTNTRVAGVGINFDGELSAVRADSIYLLDGNLILQGLLPTATPGNGGFDFYPSNAGNGVSTPQTDCYLFAASAQPQIEVYGTGTANYRLVRTIPIKSAIIGPVKSAVRTASGVRQVLLTGASAAGVITVKLPDDLHNTCQ